jgi:nicotinate-nucleotide adenylyltransferase
VSGRARYGKSIRPAYQAPQFDRDKLLRQMGERIGIFGGTFDPVHVGHLVAAVNCRHDLELDRVVLMVANVPWQKAGTRQVTPAEDRFEMVKAAVGGAAGLEASRMEIDRGGPSYTADTVSEMARLYPGAELFVIVGWDVSAELATWERLDEIRDLASLVVVNRPGTAPPIGLVQEGWRLKAVSVPNLEISSTDLRARATSGRPLDYLVPQAAVSVIRQRGLYSGAG